jgi:membrane fusion protein, multidrug efflux system
VLDKTAPEPAIPVAAVRSDGGVTYVLAVEDGKLVRHTVTLGLHTQDESLVEVREGLQTGDEIIVAKIDALKAGTVVVMKASDSAPASASAVAK